MNTPRETLYAAVAAYFTALTVGGSPLFKTSTRKLATWENVAPEDQPALLLTQTNETAIFQKGLPVRWRLNVMLFVYVHTGAQNDPAVVPAQLLNPLLDAVDAAVRIDDFANNCSTLGGLVSHCAIEGTIEIFEGNMGDEAVAKIPLTLYVPS